MLRKDLKVPGTVFKYAANLPMSLSAELYYVNERHPSMPSFTWSAILSHPGDLDLERGVHIIWSPDGDYHDGMSAACCLANYIAIMRNEKYAYVKDDKGRRSVPGMLTAAQLEAAQKEYSIRLKEMVALKKEKDLNQVLVQRDYEELE